MWAARLDQYVLTYESERNVLIQKFEDKSSRGGAMTFQNITAQYELSFLSLSPLTVTDVMIVDSIHQIIFLIWYFK